MQTRPTTDRDFYLPIFDAHLFAYNNGVWDFNSIAEFLNYTIAYSDISELYKSESAAIFNANNIMAEEKNEYTSFIIVKLKIPAEEFTLIHLDKEKINASSVISSESKHSSPNTTAAVLAGDDYNRLVGNYVKKNPSLDIVKIANYARFISQNISSLFFLVNNSDYIEVINLPHAHVATTNVAKSNKLLQKAKLFNALSFSAKAFLNYIYAAAIGNVEAKLILVKYFMGSTVANKAFAIRLLTTCAETNYTPAQVYFAMLLGSKNNKEEQLKWMKKASNLGDAVAIEWMKQNFPSSVGVNSKEDLKIKTIRAQRNTQDSVQKNNLLLVCALENYVPAQVFLYFHLKTLGEDTNYLYQKIKNLKFDRENPDAEIILNEAEFLYQEDRKEEAYAFFKFLSEHEYLKSNQYLADYYLDADSKLYNLTYAIQLLEKAAHGGYTYPLIQLAKIYEASSDIDKAIKWYAAAASHGNIDAYKWLVEYHLASALSQCGSPGASHSVIYHFKEVVRYAMILLNDPVGKSCSEDLTSSLIGYYDTAFSELNKLANEGNKEAELALNEAILNGSDNPHDAEEGVDFILHSDDEGKPQRVNP